jgi:hypothetical protein
VVTTACIGHDGDVRHPIRARMDVLRQLLNDWDPIGVRDFSALDDEYDCVLVR